MFVALRRGLEPAKRGVIEGRPCNALKEHMVLEALNTTQSVKDERFALIRGIVYVSETRIARLFAKIP